MLSERGQSVLSGSQKFNQTSIIRFSDGYQAICTLYEAILGPYNNKALRGPYHYQAFSVSYQALRSPYQIRQLDGPGPITRSGFQAPEARILL